MWRAVRTTAVVALRSSLGACSGCVDVALNEQKVATQGALKGFRIGDDKAQALARTKALRPYSIGAHAQCDKYFSGVQDFRLDKSFSAKASQLAKLDWWTFETDEKPRGAFYQLCFVGGKLAKVSYVRSRFDIETP